MDNDLILMPREDVNNLDDVVRELGIGESFETPADAVRKLKAEIESLRSSRNEVIEMCAAEAEKQAAYFLSPEYAADQPYSSFNERFACKQVASAIRSLKDHSNG